MLHQYQYQLTPRQSAQLIWNRFINVHGIRGWKIPGDLHLEHLNRIACVGKALGTLSPVLQQFDILNHVPDSTGTHRAPKSHKDRDAIIHQLQQSKIYCTIQSRVHHTFPKPRDVLHAIGHEQLCKWIMEHISFLALSHC